MEDMAEPILDFEHEGKTYTLMKFVQVRRFFSVLGSGFSFVIVVVVWVWAFSGFDFYKMLIPSPFT